MRKPTIRLGEKWYQGPGQPSIVVRSGDVLADCEGEQVGWSLLRNMTFFEYPPFIYVPSTTRAAVMYKCTLRLKGGIGVQFS